MNNCRIKAQTDFLATGKIALLSFAFLFIFALLIFAVGCHKSAGQLPVVDGESDWQRMGLHGNVSSLSLYEVSWEEDFGRVRVTLPATVDQSTVFCEAGNQVESTYYDMNGRPKWKDIFIYDITCEIWSECISYRYTNGDDSTALPRWSYINLYDDYGRIYRVEGYDYDDSGKKLSPASWVHLYEYLVGEGKIVQASYDSNGTLQWKNISEYDTSARVSSSTHYDNAGVMQWSDKFMYDAKGNRIEWSRYDSKGSLGWRDVFKYDVNGNEIECSNYDYRNELIWKDIYIYIGEDDLDNFNVNTSTDIENKFDSHGNWIVKMTLEEKQGFGGSFFRVKEIQKRSTTYFP